MSLSCPVCSKIALVVLKELFGCKDCVVDDFEDATVVEGLELWLLLTSSW